MGYSVPWQDAMEAMTGQRDILATPLLNYFEPLRVWLEAENAKNGDMIGWEMTGSAAAAASAEAPAPAARPVPDVQTPPLFRAFKAVN